MQPGLPLHAGGDVAAEELGEEAVVVLAEHDRLRWDGGMMLAGLAVPDPAVEDLAELVRAAGADDLAGRLERAAADGVQLLALTIDERAIILAALDDPPDGLAARRGVLMSEHEWRQCTGLDS